MTTMSGHPKKCAQCMQCTQCKPLLPTVGNEQDHKVVAHCARIEASYISPATPAVCSSSAAASASSRMCDCETTAYQLAPLFHTQHYVPFVRWNEQPFLKTTGSIVIIYCRSRLKTDLFAKAYAA